MIYSKLFKFDRKLICPNLGSVRSKGFLPYLNRKIYSFLNELINNYFINSNIYYLRILRQYYLFSSKKITKINYLNRSTESGLCPFNN